MEEMNEVVRPSAKMRGYDTFLVIIKLDPMATVPDTARARPTYLSSTMKNKNEVSDEGDGAVWEAWPRLVLCVPTLSVSSVRKEISVIIIFNKIVIKGYI